MMRNPLTDYYNNKALCQLNSIKATRLAQYNTVSVESYENHRTELTELNIQVSRITVIIDWFNCLVINENFSSSINACNVASMLNNPLCSRAWKSYQCKSRLWEEKNANLKIRLIREYFFFSLTKNTIFLFFFH